MKNFLSNLLVSLFIFVLPVLVGVNYIYIFIHHTNNIINTTFGIIVNSIIALVWVIMMIDAVKSTTNQ